MKTIITIFVFVWCVFLLLFAISTCFSADIVQISVKRNFDGQWIEWADLAITWIPFTDTVKSDPTSTTTKALQTWIFPVDDTYLKGTFVRTIFGEYGIRWSRDGVLFSDAESCTILKPSKPIGVKSNG